MRNILGIEYAYKWFRYRPFEVEVQIYLGPALGNILYSHSC